METEQAERQRTGTRISLLMRLQDDNLVFASVVLNAEAISNRRIFTPYERTQGEIEGTRRRMHIRRLSPASPSQSVASGC